MPPAQPEHSPCACLVGMWLASRHSSGRTAPTRLPAAGPSHSQRSRRWLTEFLPRWVLNVLPHVATVHMLQTHVLCTLSYP